MQLFGDVLFIEIGATNVGSIVQTYKPDTLNKKRQEKGYFSFGGSSIVILFEKDIVKFDDDLLKNSSTFLETKALFGQSLAKKI